MAEAYYIFTDEAGAYNKRPSESFRRSHPFYIRANVRLSASDYRVFQKEIQELNTKYGVPVGEEIKWSDLWEISKGKYRVDFLKSFTPDKIKGYYRRFFNRVVDKPSLLFIFTVTCGRARLQSVGTFTVSVPVALSYSHRPTPTRW